MTCSQREWMIEQAYRTPAKCNDKQLPQRDTKRPQRYDEATAK